MPKGRFLIIFLMPYSPPAPLPPPPAVSSFKSLNSFLSLPNTIKKNAWLSPIFSGAFGDFALQLGLHSWSGQGRRGTLGGQRGAECATLPGSKGSQLPFSPDGHRKPRHAKHLLCSSSLFTQTPCLSACSAPYWRGGATPDCSSWCFQSQAWLDCVP